MSNVDVLKHLSFTQIHFRSIARFSHSIALFLPTKMYLFSLLVGVFIAITNVQTNKNESVSNVTNSFVTTESSIVENFSTNVTNSSANFYLPYITESIVSELKNNNNKQNSIAKNKHSQFKWNSVVAGEQNSLSYMLNCTLTHMIIEVNLTGVQQPFVYLEKLKSFSICRPKIFQNIATFHLSLDDDFYRCGTIKVHDQLTGSQVYYNRVIVESKNSTSKSIDNKSVYLKCSMPNVGRMIAKSIGRGKRDTPLGLGKLVNFTEIDLPNNFMEAEIIDFGEPITQRAPYPHLNIKVKHNGKYVNTSLNVAPGTPLEMTLYLDDKSKHVYGLLGSFMKVTDNGPRQREEVIVLNGCSIDPYIFGNFETEDNGDSITAKFRAFKFPESNYVMFAGTVNVCLDKCKPVRCGDDILAFGRRRRRSLPDDLPKDPNKMFEIEMVTYLQVSYSSSQLDSKKDSLSGFHESNDKNIHLSSSIVRNEDKPTASKLIKSDGSFEGEARPISSHYQANNSLKLETFFLSSFIVIFSAFVSQLL